MGCKVVINQAAMESFFKGDGVQRLVGEAAEGVRDKANASAMSLSHRPGYPPYRSKVVIGDKCAIGLVTAGELGVNIDRAHGCLRRSI